MADRLPGGYHSPQLEVEVRLNTNESPWPPPERLVEALATEAHMLRLNRYPDRGATALRAAVGARHGVGPEQVLCTNGSNEAIQLLLSVAAGARGRATIFAPTYTLHSHLAHLAGVELVERDRDPADFTLGAEQVAKAAAEGPEVLFLCRPNNPTGTLDEIDVVEAARSGVGLVVLDEAYAEFAGLEPTSPPSDVATVRTFSKAWAMAALRLGYVVADSDLILELSERCLPYHLDAFKQAAGLAALAHETEMRERVQRIVAERNRVHEALRTLPVTAWESAANFILFRPSGAEAGDVWRALVDRSILVRDLSSLPGLAGCLRVTIGTPEENGRFIDALSAIISP